jgi:hypothetical protein
MPEMEQEETSVSEHLAAIKAYRDALGQPSEEDCALILARLRAHNPEIVGFQLTSWSPRFSAWIAVVLYEDNYLGLITGSFADIKVESPLAESSLLAKEFRAEQKDMIQQAICKMEAEPEYDLDRWLRDRRD